MTTHELKPSEVDLAERSSVKGGTSVALWLIALVVAAAIGVVVYRGIQARTSAEASLKSAADEAAVSTVSIVHAKAGAPSQEITLPGNVQAFTDTPIYARTNGYLKSWHFDIGAHVTRGQLLAEIETPEVDKQLQQARADLETAKANLNLAKSTAERWQTLLQSNSVSKQETDEKISDLSVKKAAYEGSAANVNRLEDLQSFQKVYAPFDGVVTARNTDIGALVSAGVNGTGKELFHLAAISKLRVFVSVPQTYSRASRPGAVAAITVAEFPGRTFRGVVARTANSIDPASRTLLTEVDIDNPSGELLPGAYVSVHLKLPGEVRSLVLPSNTLIFRSEGLRVAVIRNGHAQLVPVTVGRDYGDRVEVLSGIKPEDAVVADPSDSLIDGTPVRLPDKASE